MKLGKKNPGRMIVGGVNVAASVGGSLSILADVLGRVPLGPAICPSSSFDLPSRSSCASSSCEGAVIRNHKRKFFGTRSFPVLGDSPSFF